MTGWGRDVARLAGSLPSKVALDGNLSGGVRSHTSKGERRGIREYVCHNTFKRHSLADKDKGPPLCTAEMKMPTFRWAKTCVLVALASIGRAIAQETTQLCSMDEPAGRVECQTDNLSLVFTGQQNVPKFTVQNVNSPEVYSVQFQVVYQSTSQGTTGKIGPTNIALPSLTWQFSDVVQDSVGNVEFNFTSTGAHGPRDVPDLEFRMHIENNSTSMKFDTLISDVNWRSNANYFVVCYQLQQQGGGASNATIEGNTISFGESAFINVNGTAMTSEGAASALLVLDSGNSPCMVYERFVGSLEHDPVVRVGTGHNGGTWIRPAAPALFAAALAIAFLVFL